MIAEGAYSRAGLDSRGQITPSVEAPPLQEIVCERNACQVTPQASMCAFYSGTGPFCLTLKADAAWGAPGCTRLGSARPVADERRRHGHISNAHAQVAGRGSHAHGRNVHPTGSHGTSRGRTMSRDGLRDSPWMSQRPKFDSPRLHLQPQVSPGILLQVANWWQALATEPRISGTWVFDDSTGTYTNSHTAEVS